MDQSWTIVYFETVRGKFPVKDFIDSLEAKVKAKVINSIDLLEEFGIKLGVPHVKKLAGTELWELRILGGDSVRVFYVAVSGRKFLLLHGFLKKAQKTEAREIKTAVDRFNVFKLQKS